MKRSSSPIFWPIKRKAGKYVVRTKPGPHNMENSMPLAILLRDGLGYATNIKEVKEILNQGIIKVNGIGRKTYNFPIGLMDVISIGNENYRVLLSRKSLKLLKITDGMQFTKIVGKKVLGKNRFQLNLHNGTNIEVSKDEYKTGDVIVIEKNKIVLLIPFKKGATCLISGGRNQGKTGKIIEVIPMPGSQPDNVYIETNKVKIRIPKNYVFVINEKYFAGVSE